MVPLALLLTGLVASAAHLRTGPRSTTRDGEWGSVGDSALGYRMSHYWDGGRPGEGYRATPARRNGRINSWNPRPVTTDNEWGSHNRGHNIRPERQGELGIIERSSNSRAINGIQGKEAMAQQWAASRSSARSWTQRPANARGTGSGWGQTSRYYPANHYGS